ncbi:hypothetical protein ASZ90_004280 [hydrocarbon metagenome]|uniref:Uncharacterized protein n=1 Tax=hydrocarbon metagenome TaxID=938273 RepID=A0A0W8FYA5_9ZZZZ
MAIKNYTSTVPVINSIAKIEHRLAQAGALHIMKSYSGERPVGMIFQVKINDLPMTFKLPAKSDNVYKYLSMQKKRPPTKSQDDNLRQQADRTAWKILYDWIDIQVSLIELDQAEAIEVFLPYAYDGKNDQTLFDKMKNNNFKLLTAG